MTSPNLRRISRERLAAVFKDPDLVRLIEDLFYAVNNTLPSSADTVQANLTAHIADTGDAHQASAIGNTPAGGISSNTVQAALNELDTEKATAAALAAHTSDTANPHAVTKTQVGLSNVDNTSDANKPVSTATQAALDVKLPIADPVSTGVRYFEQGAPTSKAAADTLTPAEVLVGLIEYTGAAATLTLPTGADIDAGAVAGLAVNRAFEFCVINTGSGTVTIGTAAGLSLTGTMTVTAGASALFRARRTAINTYTVYRVA